ncbi:carbohydrate ABC transporter permease [Spelaeicoccus albus]|uniref:Raffinose/stachyose/melibiose transport system permease protein n=1 Tax=Spelaeicoccus albus TaxID=1280376 RepID=A0A7Z0D071_9MICO|nr:carbohydrate ABC transporter permease [Spelaeicoccus albus]NYI66999.1 raffinose/stachyose/melibiose transport system permease protein [Spelaeicoccus albus]
MISSRRDRSVTYVILIVFTIIALVPLVQILSAALSTDQYAQPGLRFPDGLHLENFVHAWTRGHFGSFLGSSVLVAVTVVVAAGIFSIMAAYAFGTMRFPGSKVLFYLFVLGLTIPEEVIVIPLYYGFRDLNLTNTYWALILPQTAQSVAFGTYWMRTYFVSASRSLIEAARLDGASSWGILWRILVPSGRPAITTMIVITFMWTWNEFLLPLVMISSGNHRTVPLGLAFFQGQHSSDISLLAAGAVLVALPVVIVYLIFQRRFIEGMVSGAVKE